jgi:hypothetical protein
LNSKRILIHYSHISASSSALGVQLWQFGGIAATVLAIRHVPIQQKFCPTIQLTNPLALVPAFYVNLQKIEQNICEFL